MTTRIHIALAVRDLDASLAFYTKLLQCEPSKLKPAYAKFEPAHPAVNLTLNETGTDVVGHVGPAHFGVEVSSTQEVVTAHERMKAAGFATMSEEGVTCCFSVQDKVWAVDPDGHRWEVFVKHEDAEVHTIPGKVTGSLELEGPCCAPEEKTASREKTEACC